VTEDGWRDVIDTNLTGVFHTVKAGAPAMIEAGNGGSTVLIGSIAAGKGWANLANYMSAKHGLVGLMRVMAIELAPHGIRANVVSPTNVGTRMFMNDVVAKVFAPELESPTMEEFEKAARWMNLLPRGWIEPEDISSAVRGISSDEARYVTVHTLPVDAGCLANELARMHPARGVARRQVPEIVLLVLRRVHTNVTTANVSMGESR